MELEIVKQLADSLLSKYNLTTNGWIFNFDNSKKRFGCCNYHKKLISLSKTLCLLNDEKEVTKTILHEVAHALVDKGNNHNNVWRNKCIEIGGVGERCYSFSNVKIKPKYIAVCNTCKHEAYFIKRPKAIRSCGQCSKGKYNEKYKMTWRKV